MNSPQSNNFIYIRQLVITWLVRNTSLTTSAALQLRRDRVLFESGHFVLAGSVLATAPVEFGEYLRLRDAMESGSEQLFITAQGTPLTLAKFCQMQHKCLLRAQVTAVPMHPKKLSEAQVYGLFKLPFELLRPRYQRAMAVALLIYLALRPSEVAKLKKKDIDFDRKRIMLRETKSQEDQPVPLLDELRDPLRRYLSHFPNDEDNLFVNASGNAWDRRDVDAVVRTRGVEKGLQGIVTPQQLRPSVVKQLIRRGVSLTLIVKLVRHSDERTLHTNYIDSLIDELSDEMNANYHPLRDAEQSQP